MNFRIQEVIKLIIPGCVILISLIFLFIEVNDLEKYTLLMKNTMAINVVVFFVIIYVIGYFVDWLASLLERLFYLFFNKPSFNLLNEATKRVKLEFTEDIIEFLCEKMKKNTQMPFSPQNAERLFKCANILKDHTTSLVLKEKLSEYYYSKIFSRNLAASFLISFLIYLFIFTLNWHNWDFNYSSIVLLILFVLSVKRWYEHSHYYSRQVFYAASESVLTIK